MKSTSRTLKTCMESHTRQQSQPATYRFGQSVMGDERDLKVSANQLSPKVIVALLSRDAFPHKVHLIDNNLT